jgi:DNA-binding NtrC family response regulator
MRQTPYSAALVDIRLPDMDGYEAFKRLREVQPNVPIILMTGFGWDPTHSIVKARQEGLQTVLYKPFRADRLMEAVEQALRIAPAARTSPSGSPHTPTPAASQPAPNAAVQSSPAPGANSHPSTDGSVDGAAEAEERKSSPSAEAAHNE